MGSEAEDLYGLHGTGRMHHRLDITYGYRDGVEYHSINETLTKSLHKIIWPQ